MHALVGADRQWAADIDERTIVVCRQRLLDQRHAGLGAGREILRDVVRGPAFIGIDDQLSVGRGGAHGGDAPASSAPPSLIFKSARPAAFAVAAAMASGLASEIV